MTTVADAAPASNQAQPPARRSLRGLLAQTEIDLRLFGMLVALAVILLTFNILSGGKFFQPTNMVTLAVQATGIAIIATGMVLVIVSRNIDLSVGSLVGFLAMTYALVMTDWIPHDPRTGRRFPVPLGHRPRHRDRDRARLSARSRASSSPTSGCPRSSSPSAACCRSAVSSGTSRTGPPCRAWTRTSSSSAVAPRDRSGDADAGSLALLGCRRHRLLVVQRAPPAAEVRLPGPADVGRGAARRGRLSRRARHRRVRQRQLLARRPRRTA